jgi:lipopolysaccharide export system permease protein
MEESSTFINEESRLITFNKEKLSVLKQFIVSSFIRPFFLTLSLVVIVLLMQFLWKYIDDLIGKGLDISQVSELIIYSIARFVPLALPIARR